MCFTSKNVASFQVVDYTEEKTIEKLQQFVDGIVTSSPSLAVCLTSPSSLNSHSAIHVVLLITARAVASSFSLGIQNIPRIFTTT